MVEHKDRFARFGIGYIELLLNLDNRELIVVNNVKGDENELMQDFISIITSIPFTRSPSAILTTILKTSILHS